MAAILQATFQNALYGICLYMDSNLKVIPQGPHNDKPALVQVIAWHPRSDKPLPEPMLTKSYDPIKGHWTTMK